MPNALELIRSAQITRPEDTAVAESLEKQPVSPVQLKVTSVGTDGITGTTSNGGELTVFSSAQNFSPRAGDILPVTFTAGQAKAVDNSKAESAQTSASTTLPVVDTSPPGTDAGTAPYRYWHFISPQAASTSNVISYIFLPQLGQWVSINATEEMNVIIKAPEVTTELIMPYSTRRRQVIGYYPNAGTTATLSTAVGATLEVGDSLSLDITVTDGNSWGATVEFLLV